MNGIKISYDIFCDFDILKAAHIRARDSKRRKTNIVKFEINMLENIAKLQRELSQKTYRAGEYFAFHVREPKPRMIQAIPYRDRIVQHVLCDCVLVPYFSQKVIYDNCACLKGKGQHFAMRRLKGFLRKFWHSHRLDGWFLKCDISKFFPSLSHDVIKKQISSEIADPDIRGLFNAVIDSYETPDSFLRRYGIPTTESRFLSGLGWRQVHIARGTPIGNQTSQTIGMFYLNPIDRFIKEVLKVKYYVRYMDDFILLHHDRAFLEDALEKIRKKLKKELKLELNEKTQIFPVKNGVKFLGFHFFLKKGKVYTKMQQRTVRKFSSRIKMLNKYYPCSEIDDDKARAILSSYKGHLKHSSSRGKGALVKKRLRVVIPKTIKSAKPDLYKPLEELQN